MNERVLPIGELVAVVLAKMKELNYAKSSITNYRRFYNRVIRYANERGDNYYSEELGSDFLKKYHHCHIDTIHETAPTKKLRAPIRYIRVLGDFQIHGVILRRKLGPLAATSCPMQFEEGFYSYCRECQNRHFSEQGNYSRMNRIKHFLFYLDEHDVQSYHAITPSFLSGYVKTFINLKSKTVRTTLVAMRCFLRHLFLNGFIKGNLGDKLPKLKVYYAPSIPRVWKASEVKTVLDTIDRGNPTGKRDYAMLLLVARLGLRASDIKALRLENIRWNTNSLNFPRLILGFYLNKPMHLSTQL